LFFKRVRTLLSSLIYWFVEIALYALFIAAIAIVIILPTELSHQVMLSDKNSFDVRLTNKDFETLMYTIKFIFFLLSLMPLILARAIRRSRNKSIVLMEASTIADEMKKDFDKAIGNLSL
jgi:predicted CDP-diglyceride synthetase/phosphatidate cytidylyltransferase